MKRRAAIILAALLFACRKDPPPPPATHTSDASAASATPDASSSFDASSAFSPVSGGLTRLECEGIAPNASSAACPSTKRPTDDLVHAVERLADLFGMHRPPPPEWWTPVRKALDAARDVDPKSMTSAERVTVQNAALHVAVAGETDLALARDALRLVDRLAFSLAEREAALAQTVDL